MLRPRSVKSEFAKTLIPAGRGRRGGVKGASSSHAHTSSGGEPSPTSRLTQQARARPPNHTPRTPPTNAPDKHKSVGGERRARRDVRVREVAARGDEGRGVGVRGRRGARQSEPNSIPPASSSRARVSRCRLTNAAQSRTVWPGRQLTARAATPALPKAEVLRTAAYARPARAPRLALPPSQPCTRLARPETHLRGLGREVTSATRSCGGRGGARKRTRTRGVHPRCAAHDARRGARSGRGAETNTRCTRTRRGARTDESQVEAG